ncbi:MAG: tetratricopeptide repeat protein [Nostocales cyanobacterium LacPavin_0920_SED1_MAG_38_18]|nr:tetratricopeptide repeat protein [Nostocales cyanobacterium LacPavin_0920_SED1_MAG_38_18]
MTVLICASTGKSITLLKEIANSGEAKVWRTNQNGYLAKIYHSPTPERVQKLAVMIANPPTEPNSHLHHVSFAWTKSALKNAQGDCVGFLMPEIKDGKELINVYNSSLRKASKLEIDWRFLHTTALNIVSIIEALHAAGYVLGDIKQQNILVNNRALPSIIDTDSFQVKNPKNGKVYRCLVGSPGYTPPELMGKDFASIEQTEVHDRFRLGVIIYQLLFSGNNHFQGKWTGAGENPEPDEIIRQGLWLYSANSLIEPVPITIPMIIVHPAIRECFLKCFNDGHKNPNLRPTAREWLEALRTGNDNLTICGRVDSHYYSRTFGNCYWCDRFAKLGIDIFPGNQTSYKNKDADSYNDSGVARYNLGDKQGAINYYNQALKINPNYALAYNNRGSARYDLGDKQGAIDDYNQALNIDPNYALAYYGRGIVRYNLGDKQGAIDDYNQALNIDPNYIHAYNNRVIALSDLQYKQGAINNSQKTLTVAPKYTLDHIKNIIFRHKTIMILVASLLFFTIGNIFSSSNNINFLKNEPGKLTESELREIANRKIEKYITGIGISFKIDEKTKIPTIANIFDNSPAALGNLKVGDQIVEVNGISTSNMSARDVNKLMRGDANTIISLRIRRQGYIDTNTTLTRQILPNPKLDKQYMRRCSAWFNLKDYSEAIKDCNEVIQIDSNNDRAYLLRGASYYLSGSKYQGVEDLRKAASLGNEKAKKVLTKIK